METIGQRIAQQRLTKRWTQERLASELGITQSVLSDIENDKVSPKWETILSTAEKLEIPVASILPQDAFNIIQNNNNNNNVGGVLNNYSGSEEERKLWESLLQAKEDLIQNQKLFIETLQAQIKGT
jgi:transcriptional regulator with XRE-family HTH domain